MRLRTLGGLGLPGGGFRRQKPLLLLAYLAVEGPRDRRYLSELFWPTAANPRQSLSVALSQIRHHLPQAVHVDGFTLSTRLACDAVELKEAAADGDSGRVVELYGGPFLAGVDIPERGVELEEWLFLTRELLALRAQRAFVSEGERELAAGRHAYAARFAERAVSLGTDAVDADADLLRRLHRLLLVTDNPRAAPVKKEAEAMGLPLEVGGEAGLEGVGTRPTAHNVARLSSPLVGRTSELEEIDSLLLAGTRLLTVTGLGGTGKSRLVEALATRLAHSGRYDRVHFVALESASEAAEVPARIAAAMGTTLSGRDPVSVLAQQLVADRAVLILDNFEHLTAAAAGIMALLDGCPGLNIVVSSREPLGLPAESFYPLGGLGLPSSVEAVSSEEEGSEAVDLFLLTARRYDPRFGLDEAGAQAVFRICHLVTGLPLAVELAGALMRVIPPTDLARELEADLDALVSVQRDTPSQKAALRLTFERSWKLLTDEQRAALAGCSLFRGGFTRDAAARVLGMDLRTLTGLMDRALLQRRGNRYDLHPLVRQYAAEKLDAEAAAGEWRSRHAEHFSEQLAAKRSSYQRAGERSAFEELDRESANIRAAWEWAAAARRHDLLDEMAYMLYGYLAARLRREELTHLLTIGLDSVEAGSLVAARLTTYLAKHSTPDQPAKAQALLESALAIARHEESDGDVGMILSALGLALIYQREFGAARRALSEAVPLLEHHDDGRSLGGCLSNLGFATKEYGTVLSLYDRAITACRRAGNISDLAKIIYNRAILVAGIFGDYAGGVAGMAEALELEHENAARTSMLCHMHSFSALFLIQLGDLDSAREHHAKARRLVEERQPWEEHKFKLDIDDWVHGHMLFARGNVAEAVAFLEAIDLPITRDHELIAWSAFFARDQARVRHFHALAKEAVGTQAVEFEAPELQAFSLLLGAADAVLDAAARGEPSGASVYAVAPLVSALELITRFMLVPYAFDAFVLARLVAPKVAGLALVRLAATHASARQHTRRHAQELLRAEGAPFPPPPQGEAPFAPRPGPHLAAKQVLKLAKELEVRLRAPLEAAEPTPLRA